MKTCYSLYSIGQVRSFN